MSGIKIEYICTYCGNRSIRLISTGRPMPGRCPAKSKIVGKSVPHTWVKNRTMWNKNTSFAHNGK